MANTYKSKTAALYFIVPIFFMLCATRVAKSDTDDVFSNKQTSDESTNSLLSRLLNNKDEKLRLLAANLLSATEIKEPPESELRNLGLMDKDNIWDENMRPSQDIQDHGINGSQTELSRDKMMTGALKEHDLKNHHQTILKEQTRKYQNFTGQTPDEESVLREEIKGGPETEVNSERLEDTDKIINKVTSHEDKSENLEEAPGKFNTEGQDKNLMDKQIKTHWGADLKAESIGALHEQRLQENEENENEENPEIDNQGKIRHNPYHELGKANNRQNEGDQNVEDPHKPKDAIQSSDTNRLNLENNEGEHGLEKANTTWGQGEKKGNTAITEHDMPEDLRDNNKQKEPSGYKVTVSPEDKYNENTHQTRSNIHFDLHKNQSDIILLTTRTVNVEPSSNTKSTILNPEAQTKSLWQLMKRVQQKDSCIADRDGLYGKSELISVGVGGALIGGFLVFMSFYCKAKLSRYYRGNYQRVPLEYDFELSPRLKSHSR